MSLSIANLLSLTLKGNEMQPTYDFFDLVYAMKKRHTVSLTRVDGVTFSGIINRLAAEDGSGRNWNVALCCKGINTGNIIFCITTN